MSLQLCVLGSGSSGNCIYVACGDTHVLIDAGLSFKETTRRMEAIGRSVENIQSICVTHEHDDHKSALGVFKRRLGVALYGNAGTADAIERRAGGSGLEWNVFTTGAAFVIGELTLQPFSVPHDSYDPVGFVVRAGESRVGVVTDMGIPTRLVREHLRDCSVVVLESNHDTFMLRDAPRPWSLKQRIAGSQGHLSNDQAGQLLVDIAGPHLKTAFLAHLSSDCNRPELALGTVQRYLRENAQLHIDLKLTYPDRPSELVVC